MSSVESTTFDGVGSSSSDTKESSSKQESNYPIRVLTLFESLTKTTDSIDLQIIINNHVSVNFMVNIVC